MNGVVLAFGANNTGGNTINADCNGVHFQCSPLMVGVVGYEFFLTNGTDDMPATSDFSQLPTPAMDVQLDMPL